MSKGLEWKKIENFSNYSVSSMGEIRNDKTNKILKQSHNNKGYMYCYIKRDDGVYKNCQVHRLVAKTFIPNINDKPCVNHKDYNPSNNNVENLEWVTHSENCLWSSKNISLASKGKNKSLEHRKSIRKSMLNLENSKNYIYKTKTGYMFRFRPSKNEDINKTFKTIEQAIEYRNNYFKEHKEYVIE